jgi:hypothetical protein
MGVSWNATALFANDDWEIDVVLGTFASEMEARGCAQMPVDAEFVTQDNEDFLMVTVNNGDKRYYRDNEITIKKICAEKQKNMGKPIDMNDQESVHLMIDAFLSGDTRYVVELEDMVVSDKRIGDLIDLHGVGFRPDHIAWGVKQQMNTTEA